MIPTLEQWVPQIPISFWIQRYIDLPVLLKWAKLSKHASILEIGAGTGCMSKYLAKRLKPETYTAVDANSKLITKAESSLEKLSWISLDEYPEIPYPVDMELRKSDGFPLVACLFFSILGRKTRIRQYRIKAL